MWQDCDIVLHKRFRFGASYAEAEPEHTVRAAGGLAVLAAWHAFALPARQLCRDAVAGVGVVGRDVAAAAILEAA